jgi:hypothetical protein
VGGEDTGLKAAQVSGEAAAPKQQSSLLSAVCCLPCGGLEKKDEYGKMKYG